MFLELRHLRSLKAIQRHGSLSGAAAQLHLTQSALSHQIRALEDYFGARLFFRKTRPLRWTPAGERLLALAEGILPQVDAAEQALRDTGAGQQGRLHTAVECHSCFDWLMPAMDDYRSQWPQVELDLSLGYSFHPLPALYRGEVDLVITSDPEDLGGLDYVPLFRYEMLLAIPGQHRLGGRAWVEPADLAPETVISYPVCRSRLDIFHRFLDPAGVQPAAERTAELTVMLIQLVANGRGVAALPNWALTEYLDRDNLAALRLGPTGLWRTLYAAVRREDRDRPYMDAFIRLARVRTSQTLSGIHPL
ncbi:MAG: LysR family transcriptional regulator [Ectothiorhodospiraceae bacterium]|nr:LysR family transcriptional regulator [Ectothiorhodospiraceae bacterium]